MNFKPTCKVNRSELPHVTPQMACLNASIVALRALVRFLVSVTVFDVTHHLASSREAGVTIFIVTMNWLQT